MSAFYSQRGRGGLMHRIKLPTGMQELELKMQGGIIAGFYSKCFCGPIPVFIPL